MIYKNYYEAVANPIEDTRKKAGYDPYIFNATTLDAGNTTDAYNLSGTTYFGDSPQNMGSQGYVINDGPDPINVDLKFSRGEAENYSDDILLNSGDELDLGMFGLFSNIRVDLDEGATTADYRIFIT